MASNYPAGVTDADIDALLGDDYEYELSEEDIEAEYLERIELEAAALPPDDFTLDLSADWTDAEYEAWLAKEWLAGEKEAYYARQAEAEEAASAASADWTDEDIVEYELWLNERDAYEFLSVKEAA